MGHQAPMHAGRNLVWGVWMEDVLSVITGQRSPSFNAFLRSLLHSSASLVVLGVVQLGAP